MGAGNGRFIYRSAERVREVVGIELSDNMIEQCPACEHLRQGDALDLPFENSSLDVVFAGNLLHHLVEPEKALLETARVSRGGIALCEWNRDHSPMAAFGAIPRMCRGLLSYSERTLEELVRGTGTDVRGVTRQGYVYENRSPVFRPRASQALENKLTGGAHHLLARYTEPSVTGYPGHHSHSVQTGAGPQQLPGQASA